MAIKEDVREIPDSEHESLSSSPVEPSAKPWDAPLQDEAGEAQALPADASTVRGGRLGVDLEKTAEETQCAADIQVDTDAQTGHGSENAPTTDKRIGGIDTGTPQLTSGEPVAGAVLDVSAVSVMATESQPAVQVHTDVSTEPNPGTIDASRPAAPAVNAASRVLPEPLLNDTHISKSVPAEACCETKHADTGPPQISQQAPASEVLGNEKKSFVGATKRAVSVPEEFVARKSINRSFEMEDRTRVPSQESMNREDHSTKNRVTRSQSTSTLGQARGQTMNLILTSVGTKSTNESPTRLETTASERASSATSPTDTGSVSPGLPVSVDSGNVRTSTDSNLESTAPQAAEERVTQPALKPLSPAKSSQETAVAELRAQRRALITALAALPHVQELIEEDEESLSSSPAPDGEPTDAEVMGAAHKIVKKHIKLLHEYNEIKDVGQGLMGLIADQRGVRIIEIQEEFGIDAKD